jgi:hypothetical protein
MNAIAAPPEKSYRVEMDPWIGIRCARESGRRQRRKKNCNRDRQQQPNKSNERCARHPESKKLAARHAEGAKRRILDPFGYRLPPQRLPDNESSHNRQTKSKKFERDCLKAE